MGWQVRSRELKPDCVGLVGITGGLYSTLVGEKLTSKHVKQGREAVVCVLERLSWLPCG
jgi:hypothetical protein